MKQVNPLPISMHSLCPLLY